MNGVEALVRRQPFETSTVLWEETPLPTTLVRRRFPLIGGGDTDIEDRSRSGRPRAVASAQHSAILDVVKDDPEVTRLARQHRCSPEEVSFFQLLGFMRNVVLRVAPQEHTAAGSIYVGQLQNVEKREKRLRSGFPHIV